MAQIAFKIDDELYEKFKEYCYNVEDRSVNSVLTRFIKEKTELLDEKK